VKASVPSCAAVTYKGFTALCESSPDDGGFVGHVAGITDIIGFHAAGMEELRQAFQLAVDDYLEACARLGRAPQKG
jgi:predicted HicB family RNase H-like nuclease